MNAANWLARSREIGSFPTVMAESGDIRDVQGDRRPLVHIALQAARYFPVGLGFGPPAGGVGLSGGIAGEAHRDDSP